MAITKISTIPVGQQAQLVLVVLSATARETKAKKPYLQLELFDGTDKISGNYWDWSSGKIPEKNAILNVTAQVTEYIGTKQLNVKGLSVNTDHHLSEFEPSSNLDLADVYKEAYSMASDINDKYLRCIALEALETYMNEWLTIPGAKTVHHAFTGGTLVHSVSVAKIAKAISRNVPEANTDLCIVGGLLHDIGKLRTYKTEGLSIDLTTLGKLYEHTHIGTEIVSDLSCVVTAGMTSDEAHKCFDKLMILKHIILSHHGVLEYGAAVTPMCLEAHIVHCADGVDAATQQLREASRKLNDDAMWTDRIYTLSNSPQITPQYISRLFEPEA